MNTCLKTMTLVLLLFGFGMSPTYAVQESPPSYDTTLTTPDLRIFSTYGVTVPFASPIEDVQAVLNNQSLGQFVVFAGFGTGDPSTAAVTLSFLMDKIVELYDGSVLTVSEPMTASVIAVLGFNLMRGGALEILLLASYSSDPAALAPAFNTIVETQATSKWTINKIGDESAGTRTQYKIEVTGVDGFKVKVQVEGTVSNDAGVFRDVSDLQAAGIVTRALLGGCQPSQFSITTRDRVLLDPSISKILTISGGHVMLASGLKLRNMGVLSGLGFFPTLDINIEDIGINFPC